MITDKDLDFETDDEERMLENVDLFAALLPGAWSPTRSARTSRRTRKAS